APDRRKNLILTVAAQGALDQMKAAEVIAPEPVAGKARSTTVSATGAGLKPKFGLAGRLPAVIGCAPAKRQTATRRKPAPRERITVPNIASLPNHPHPPP